MTEPTGSAQNVLLIGASGLIGTSVAARLLSNGHEVTGVARRAFTPSAGMTVKLLDFTTATQSDWMPLLRGVDAVINCAGVLQDSFSDSTIATHAHGPAHLFDACVAAGVKRVIHFSAVGIDHHALTPFSATKRAGDEYLMSLDDLDWVILRPSVVMGSRVFGASALMRGLAALPILPSMPGTAPVQPIHLRDVVETVVFFSKNDAPSRQAIELVGPERREFDDWVAMLRGWLGWRPAYILHIPRPLAALLYRLGDAAAWLGWTPPVRSTARKEMTRGAIGDAKGLGRITGLVPRNIEQEFMREPASVQERWFARLYFLKPLVFTVFPAFWIATGLVSIGPGRDRGIQLVMEGGASYFIAALATLSGGLADIVIGCLIAFRRTARLGLYAAFLISIAYAIIGTILLPHLWIDPLGPMLKIAPVMVFNLVALAILEER